MSGFGEVCMEAGQRLGGSKADRGLSPDVFLFGLCCLCACCSGIFPFLHFTFNVHLFSSHQFLPAICFLFETVSHGDSVPPMANDFTHGGHIRDLAGRAGCGPEALLDFSANINPLGPPPWFRSVVARELSLSVHYPSPYAEALCRAGAERFRCGADEVVAGNGSTEILYALPAALGFTRALVPVPAYTDYRRACELAGVAVETVPLYPRDGFAVDFEALAEALERHGDAGCAVFLGQPNNPTGRTFAPGALCEVAERFPRAWFVVDEAFADFVPGLDRLAARRPANVVVLYSLTKFYAVPGLRLGVGFAAPDVAAAIRRHVPPWSVNTLAQAVGVEALGDADYRERSIAACTRLRESLAADLAKLPGLDVFPGEANFLLCRLDDGAPSVPDLAKDLLASRIAVRDCASFDGLGVSASTDTNHGGMTSNAAPKSRWLRLAVRGEGENARLVDALAHALGVMPPTPSFVAGNEIPGDQASTGVLRLRRPRRTPAIMFQGCSSNAGKSVLAAALCRILLQDGYSVAPFKAQNMSLNSFVTRDGGEMGRAQVTQAQACRLDPDVRMNPVLLKPSSDTGSQVVVMGRPVGSMRVAEYVRYKPTAFARAREAYDSLAAEHDVVVIEGAGSPAEINLKAHDIVNMNMARHARAAVLLAGDIDRGGVFASFVGTMELLDEWERALVRGHVVNRFRGDASLLDPALAAIADRTGTPFAGVVPYVKDLGLPEEDSVSFKSGVLDMAPSPERVVEIAVLDLPHISNFTDIDALAAEPDVLVRVVRRADELGEPHAVILPGSKNVPGDMRALVDSGLAAGVAALAARGEVEIVGICAGFQMLGRTIADPHGLESRGEAAGLGILPLRTELARDKTLSRCKAEHVASGLGLRGYEIHHGRTLPDAGGEPARVAVRRDGGEVLGYARADGMVWGSYLHGVFDADAFRRWFVDRLRGRAGFPPLGRGAAVYDLEPALDRLAAVVRESLDMGLIYSLLSPVWRIP